MEASGRQPTVERRLDEGRKILWVQHFARNRYNGFTRNELLSREGRRGVVADQVKNSLPLWIGDGGLLA